MTIPFYCLVATMLLPYLSKLPLFLAILREGSYDNRQPREQQARLTGWGKRAVAAHQNSFEILPVFASGVFINHLTQADATWSARLAILFVVSRIVYNAFYLADLASLRSATWFVGLFCCFALALMGTF